jgi:molecular chaperone DnaK
MVLTRMKQFAEAYLGEEIENAVVTVPASFEDAQREAMKAACAMAGLTTRRVLNEPTAATMGFGNQCVASVKRRRSSTWQ